MKILWILLALLLFFLVLHIPPIHQAICPYPQVAIWICRI
jgi:hypothetical protein